MKAIKEGSIADEGREGMGNSQRSSPASTWEPSLFISTQPLSLGNQRSDDKA